MKKMLLKNMKSVVYLVVATFLQVFTIKAVVRPANLLPSGFMGIGVLVQSVTEHIVPGGIPLNISTLLLNLPVAFLCYRGLNKRFTILSVGQIAFSSILLTILDFKPILDDVMLSVIFGGVMSGLYITLALQADGSTGGTDFIALYVSNKKNRSIWEYVFVGNAILILIFGVTSGWESAAYSILFQFISTKTIENFHRRYEQLTIQVTTQKPEEVMTIYFQHYRHGMTCVDAVGGYSNQPFSILYSVISSYELKVITEHILQADPKAIINVMHTQRFYGNFYRKQIGEY